jgi:hypothetical protein
MPCQYFFQKKSGFIEMKYYVKKSNCFKVLTTYNKNPEQKFVCSVPDLKIDFEYLRETGKNITFL